MRVGGHCVSSHSQRLQISVTSVPSKVDIHSVLTSAAPQEGELLSPEPGLSLPLAGISVLTKYSAELQADTAPLLPQG